LNAVGNLYVIPKTVKEWLWHCH